MKEEKLTKKLKKIYLEVKERL